MSKIISTKYTIAITNPCKIKKDKEEILICETITPNNHVQKYKVDNAEQIQKITTRFKPEQIRDKTIAICNKKSSVTFQAIEMLESTEIIFIDFKNKRPTAYITPFKKVPMRMNYELKLSNMTKKEKHKYAFVFCKGVCSGRLSEARQLNIRRQNKDIDNIIKKMKLLDRQLIKCTDRTAMHGYEGNIADYYYSTFKLLLPKQCDFKQRNKSSPDLMNVMMNSAHGILRCRIQRILEMHGLNTQYGFLHYQKDKPRQPFMAWDFAEFWIPKVDKLCFYAIMKGIFKNTDLINAKTDTFSHNSKWLKDSAWCKLNNLLRRITDEEIHNKIEQFENRLLDNTTFSWTTK